MIFQISVPVILFGFTPSSLKVHVNVFRCLKVSLSSVTVLVSVLPTLFVRSVTVLVLNGLSQFTHHVLLRLTFFVMVVYVVLSCTTYVNVLVRLLGSLKNVATSSSLEPLCIKGSFFVLKKLNRSLFIS